MTVSTKLPVRAHLDEEASRHQIPRAELRLS